MSDSNAPGTPPPARPPVPPLPAQYAYPPQPQQQSQHSQPAPPPRHPSQPVPPAGYTAPYAAPYTAPRPPVQGVQPPAPPATGSGLGLVALILALLATVGASAVGAASAWQLGLAAGKGSATAPMDADFDWSVLAPVRDWALAGELAFWIGTAVGITALVIGVIALVTQRGRVPGMIAVVVAALGPIVFFAAVAGTLSAALTAGSGIGG